MFCIFYIHKFSFNTRYTEGRLSQRFLSLPCKLSKKCLVSNHKMIVMNAHIHRKSRTQNIMRFEYQSCFNSRKILSSFLDARLFFTYKAFRSNLHKKEDNTISILQVHARANIIYQVWRHFKQHNSYIECLEKISASI